jgi:hypothetical protein
MFSFLHRTGPRNPSGAIRKALDKDGLPAGIQRAAQLRVIESHGRYSDRKVTYIRMFDPVRAAERHLDVRSFSDLDAYPSLILKAGHIEPDGIVVITRRWPAAEAEASDHRWPAHPDRIDDRSGIHGDRQTQPGRAS